MTEATPTHDLITTTPTTLLNLAVSQGADLDRLEKLMMLQTRWEENQARKAYTVAMSEFKKNPPDIEKDSHVEYRTDKGLTKYNHASLGNVAEKINAALALHGLSVSWITDQTEKGVTVTCKITHVLGHSESTALTALPDTSGGKNAIQALGSAISYLERYSVLALTGLATSDMDDDGQMAIEHINEKQLSTLTDIANEKGLDTAKFLVYMEAESFDKILAADYNKALYGIRLAKGKTKEEKI